MPAECRKKGSITIFMILSLGMVMSLFFSMSEVVRYFCMKSTATSLARSAAQSGLGDYNRPLYEKYGILAVDLGYGRAEADYEKLLTRMDAYASYGGNPGHDHGILTLVNLCRMDPTESHLSDVTLLTDYGGAAFKKEAAIQEIVDIPKDTMEKWQNAAGVIGGAKGADSYVTEHEVKVVGVAQKGAAIQSVSDEDVNPVSAVDEFKKRGVLAQVMGSGMSVSAKKINTVNAVSKRTLNRGNSDKKSLSVTDDLMYRMFLMDHLSCFTNIRDDRAMSYELEYVLCGKDSDEENLRSVVKRLLLIREGLNTTSLMNDAARRGQAESLGAAMAAACLNPELEPAFTAALIAAWAYVESVLDVRLLLSGKKLPLIKDGTGWTSELYTLPEYLDTSIMAKEDPSGIDYRGYIFGMLYTTSEKNLGLRPLDLMEEMLHRDPDYAGVRMDNMMVESKYHVTMSAAPLFLSLAPLVSTQLSQYGFNQEEILSYL